MINNFSTRFKVFIIAVSVIVACQVFYSIQNVRSFQNSYVETLKLKCNNLGGFLKNDVEYVLNLNIPLTKLIKMENTLKEIMGAIPELQFIEITDLDSYVLYYADHKSIGRIKPGTKKSAILNPIGIKLERYGLSKKSIDTILPVFNKRKNIHVGNINMRISPDIIIGKSMEILLDMVTVIMTSLIITFELLSFFVSYSISNPLVNVVKEVQFSTKNLSLLSGRSYLVMNELGTIIEKYNNYMIKLKRFLGPHISAQQFFPELGNRFRKDIKEQSSAISTVVEGGNKLYEKKASSLKPVLSGMLENLSVLNTHLITFMEHLSGYRLTPDTHTKSDRYDEKKDSGTLVHYSYIRPIIFFFVMADGFCASFFPMFVDTLYTPILGFSREIIIGLPISVFMFFIAVSMPVSGKIADSRGWHRILIAGIALNATGLILTSMAENIYQLLIFRSITAIGFGMTFMSCQQFVVSHTAILNRALGMAAFLAAFFGGDICGTVMGGMLADRIGYRSVFFASGLVSVFSLLACIMIFKGKVEPIKKKRLTAGAIFPFKELFRVFSDREFLSIILLQAIPAKLILIGFLYYLVPLYLKSIGTLQSNIGRVIMCYGLIIVFGGPFFSRYFDNAAHRKYYIVTGGIITGLSMLSFWFMRGFGPLLFVVTMLGVAHTFSVSSQVSLITETKIIKKIGTGTGMGLYRFWERAGNVAGPVVVGFFIAKEGYEKSIIFLGAISFICSLIYLVVILVERKLNP